MSTPPEELQELERRLVGVQFEPRASLGAEILGRFQRGDTGADGRPPFWRRVRGLAAAVALVGLGLSVVGLVALRTPALASVDHCCQDFDGGGDADDGLLVVTRKGSEVKRLAIYEDRDGSRSFTPADVVRFARTGGPMLHAHLLPGAITTEFCCLDYDGGGPDDDALLVVGLPPDRIAMAAIFERRVPPGAPSPLR
ncbi:MAG: hypothetical protein SF070_06585 [Gemmatimonadota bacterium]|nr:hypothetical protein [Gemmatimonadota bacterium]